MNTKKENKRMTNKGFALFLAVVIMSILLSISYSIVNISTKELILSMSSRESQFAFYAADSGIECAMYWDFKNLEPDLDGNQISISAFDKNSNGANVNCNGAGNIANWTKPLPSRSGNIITTDTSFDIKNLNSSDGCVSVFVKKTENVDGLGNITSITTNIESRGYNTCDVNNPRRVERGIETNY